MALKLDNNLLEELGLGGLPDHEKQLLLRQIYEKLEMNVGVRLADQMSNEQLDEFEKFVDSNDDKGAFQWLETNFPNYKDVVNQEFEKLKGEIRQYAPQMLAVAQQGGAAGAPGAMPGGQPQMPGQPTGQMPGAMPGQPGQFGQQGQTGQDPSGPLQGPAPQFGGPGAPMPGQMNDPMAGQQPQQFQQAPAGPQGPSPYQNMNYGAPQQNPSYAQQGQPAQFAPPQPQTGQPNPFAQTQPGQPGQPGQQAQPGQASFGAQPGQPYQAGQDQQGPQQQYQQQPSFPPQQPPAGPGQ